jgi:hypothetical protein
VTGLSELTKFDLDGGRPTDYVGCGDTDLGKTALPASFFTLSKLTDLNLEYTCLGGTLDGFAKLTKLTSLQIHGNFISGGIPQEMEQLKDVR